MADALPNYCMSIYLFLESMTDELQWMMNSYWWGAQRNDTKGIHWLSWEKLVMAKEVGGMGLRPTYGCNLVLLGKQG